MKKLFYLSNEAAGGTPDQPQPPAPVPAPKKTKKMVPDRDNDFGNLCKTVSNSWKDNPQITLAYITQVQFKARVDEYSNTLKERQTTGGQRPSLTLKLANADKKIEQGIKAIKRYLYEKYEQEAFAYYAGFGMEYKNRGYRLPNDRNKRKDVLAQIQAGIAEQELEDKKYGAAFWQAMDLEYTALVAEAGSKDGQVSLNVGNKNLLKADLTEVLNSLIDVIRGNYRDLAPAQLRHWGFQKDKY